MGCFAIFPAGGPNVGEPPHTFNGAFEYVGTELATRTHSATSPAFGGGRSE